MRDGRVRRGRGDDAAGPAVHDPPLPDGPPCWPRRGRRGVPGGGTPVPGRAPRAHTFPVITLALVLLVVGFLYACLLYTSDAADE